MYVHHLQHDVPSEEWLPATRTAEEPEPPAEQNIEDDIVHIAIESVAASSQRRIATPITFDFE
jgi:hypothetical protein